VVTSARTDNSAPSGFSSSIEPSGLNLTSTANYDTARTCYDQLLLSAKPAGSGTTSTNAFYASSQSYGSGLSAVLELQPSTGASERANFAENCLVRISAKRSVPNAMVLLVGSASADIPSSFQGSSIVAVGRSCIAIGTVSVGDVEIVLTDEQVATKEMILASVSEMSVDIGRVDVETSEGSNILSLAVAVPLLRVEIWVSDLEEPNLVLISVAGIN
jgi:hypothetical protein